MHLRPTRRDELIIDRQDYPNVLNTTLIAIHDCTNLLPHHSHAPLFMFHLVNILPLYTKQSCITANVCYLSDGVQKWLAELSDTRPLSCCTAGKNRLSALQNAENLDTNRVTTPGLYGYSRRMVTMC
jgi:hypothetical protein